ncbi:MAG: DUF4203 domain-containing protein [Chthoniobacterales bacterium]
MIATSHPNDLMQITIATLLLAAVLLFFGQRIYWLFVGIVGFFAGMNLATHWLVLHPEWLVLVVAIVAGLLGAVLAVFAQKLAIGIAGFFAGGHFALLLLPNLGYATSDRFALLLFFGAGIIAALLAVALLDWALITLSALIGAALIANWAVDAPGIRALVFVALFALGFIVQASLLRGRRRVAT